ncbi:oxidoreductase [Dyella nitratireducens]|uniref:Short-chain dehydrogenase n=1 Tax=Dyella nitratireducens TaxID=1849580 RepID=A0ABQ1G9E4_9GAMM|nr:oxidoreductase [Dyella nitratireducens]GGA39326.1 short-chain dehydrogenase [Dyella nitratireducens]GLQ40430.1 short-chain dehydrogenase [Dyella nitratireducens]
MQGFTANDVPNQKGKCFLVTGANSGIGFEAARVLAQRGGRVLMACRSKENAEAAIARIRAETPEADLFFLPLDLSDLDSVRQAAELVRRESRIDALVNNAGVMTPPLMRTKQGFELQFGVNHLACFALTHLLLPKLVETPGARVVVTGSVIHSRGRIDWSDINADNSYDKTQRYADSKLANLLFLFELDRRLRAHHIPVTAVGCHPGMASTGLGRYMGVLQVLNPLVSVILNSAHRGAWPTLQAATDVIKPGAYYGPIGFKGVRGRSGEASRDPRALDATDAQRLWKLSEQMTGVSSAI